MQLHCFALEPNINSFTAVRHNLMGMTNYPIGPHRTPIYVILSVHITLRPMQTGRPIQTGQLRHKKTYVPKLIPYGIYTAQQRGCVDGSVI